MIHPAILSENKNYRILSEISSGITLQNHPEIYFEIRSKILPEIFLSIYLEIPPKMPSKILQKIISEIAPGNSFWIHCKNYFMTFFSNFYKDCIGNFRRSIFMISPEIPTEITGRYLA